eukprot:4414992-Pleurochrysis_carterae.AAC.1
MGSKCWTESAVVTSEHAVVLELVAEDFEVKLEADAALAEATHSVVAELQKLRSPRHLRMLWPFFGADADDLERVGNALAVEVVRKSTCGGWPFRCARLEHFKASARVAQQTLLVRVC